MVNYDNYVANIKSPGISFKSPIAYLFGFISGFIIYMIAKVEDTFTKFHAIQATFISGLFLSITFIVNIILNYSNINKLDNIDQNAPQIVIITQFYSNISNSTYTYAFILELFSFIYGLTFIYLIYKSFFGKLPRFPILGRASVILSQYPKRSLYKVFIFIIIVNSILIYIYIKSLLILHELLVI